MFTTVPYRTDGFERCRRESIFRQGSAARGLSSLPCHIAGDSEDNVFVSNRLGGPFEFAKLAVRGPVAVPKTNDALSFIKGSHLLDCSLNIVGVNEIQKRLRQQIGFAVSKDATEVGIDASEIAV